MSAFATTLPAPTAHAPAREPCTCTATTRCAACVTWARTHVQPREVSLLVARFERVQQRCAGQGLTHAKRERGKAVRAQLLALFLAADRPLRTHDLNEVLGIDERRLRRYLYTLKHAGVLRAARTGNTWVWELIR